MKYDLDYQGATEIFESRVITSIPPITGRLLENSYLPEFDQDILEEAERLNAVLPLIKWEVDNNDLSEAMSDELYLYYEDLLKGRLDGILDEEEAPIIIKDLTESYIKSLWKRHTRRRGPIKLSALLSLGGFSVSCFSLFNCYYIAAGVVRGDNCRAECFRHRHALADSLP